MAREQVIAAIDIGSTKVSTVVGGVGREGETEIHGVGVSPSRGLKKGMIVDIEATVESIRASLAKAERTSGFKIVSAHVAISGDHVTSINNRGAVAVSRADHVITPEDVGRVIESARAVPVPGNREVIHILPRSYTIDGRTGILNPVGMAGYRLEVETHIVTGAETSIQNLTKCINQAGIDVDDLVLQPIAAGEAALTPEERESGVLLVDIGGGTTDLALYVDGNVLHTSCLPVGGNHLTNDLAIALRLPFQVAEDLKVSHGVAQSSQVDPLESVELPESTDDSGRTIARRHLAEILQARVEEIFEMIVVDIKRSGYDGLLPAGMVITGGTGNLRGIDLFARQLLGLPARVARPRGLRGMTDTVTDPAYATSVGLVLWGIKTGEHDGRGPSSRRKGDLYHRLLGWAKELLPQ